MTSKTTKPAATPAAEEATPEVTPEVTPETASEEAAEEATEEETKDADGADAKDANAEATAEESVPGLPDIFMQVCTPDGKGKLRVREEAADDGAVVTRVVHQTKLRVLDNENPDWVLVELTDGSGAKGFVKRPFVVEAPDSAAE